MGTETKSITACTMDCPDACSLLVSTDTGGAVQIRGNPDHPITKGFICRKMHQHTQRLQNKNRILYPMRRHRSSWQKISWDAALELCAQHIQSYREQPASILHIQSDGAKGVLKKGSQLLFAKLGATRLRGSLCDAAGYIATVHDFGSRANHQIDDLLNASRIVNWAKDLSRSSIHTAAMVRKARQRGTRVLRISPGGDDHDAYADEHIRIRPGCDRFLAAAAAKICLERELFAREILDHTRHWIKYRQVLLRHSLDELVAFCNVTMRDVETLVDFYTDKQPTASLIGAGLQRYDYGGENVRHINALALLTGNIGKSGGGSYFHLHSFANLNLDWTKDHPQKPRRAFFAPTVGREILNATDPSVKMIWVNGNNIVNQAPNTHQIIQAFNSVDFVVVVDAFMNDTAQHADLILPSTLMLEQEDIIGSFLHPYVHYVPSVLNPPGETRNDFDILTELGHRLDPPIQLPDTDTCFRKSLDTPLLSESLEELRKRNFIKANRPKVAYAGMTFDHSDGKYRFPTALHTEPPPPEGYSLRLLTLVRRNAIHSQMLSEVQNKQPVVWVAPDNPGLKHIDQSKAVCLASPLGRLPVNLEITPGIHAETVIYRRGDWKSCGGGANQLIKEGLTDIGNGAPYYSQYVRLENV